MNIFCDFHHSDLWWSHYIIMEQGLGHKLFRPYGMEWFDEEYCNLPEAIAKQYLSDTPIPIPIAKKFHLAEPILRKADESLYVNGDTLHGCPYYPLIRTLKLCEFESADIDVIMSTLSNNQEPFLRLKNELCPTAKLLREEGNINGWENLDSRYQNVMTSDVVTFEKISTTHKILYHQRFDTNIFCYHRPTEFDTIRCFMPGFRKPALMEFAKVHMSKLNFKFIDHGPQSPHGNMNTKGDIADAISKSAFVWHVKPGGDGFGHIVHNAFALGRPLITVGAHYKGQIASRLMEDGVTCLLLDENDISGNIEKIKSCTKEQITEMGIAAHQRFKSVVKYDDELEEIKLFMENLI